MEIDFFCPRWGSESVGWGKFASRIKRDGFAGVEVFPLDNALKNKDMLAVLNDNRLSYILLHTELNEGPKFDRYLDALERNLYALLTYQDTTSSPEFIVSQTGREYYTRSQMETCFVLCDRIMKESGIKIIHETHRNKWSYAAHVVNEYLKNFPSLELALDISHWVCVSESFLEDQEDAVERAIQHTRHIHARVGFPQGPQVTDPRTRENQVALQHHLAWWDRWIKYLKEEGAQRATITPEFGPSPYMFCFPNTSKPVADQYQINCWMRELLYNRYSIADLIP
ncbi:sugar phosphate isomerase/epimerase [Sphingobacterium sp. SG20118]|uniref:hypothetical protein n=1 Tax=Sphingobacterium TaxID=28453 RepID=UPI0004F5CECB|nr:MULTISPECIES: hypothetical protein [Sphingobacterium]AIM36423.1 hypothetical protein KO02_06695 [Sphingobacterium sp. ML3W]MDH5827438.1 sugar phosphate isomerase/epimerase [Sphingobacterium faecium]